jgi:hypothetical protein
VLQYDGNFVVYNAQDHPLWATSTHDGTLLVVQEDGNVVLYAGGPGSYRPVWASGTSSLSPVSLVMQDDGNLVAYNAVQPLWASASGRGPIASVSNGVGTTWASPSGKYLAVFQADGNFVVYQTGAVLIPLWSTRTQGSGATDLLIQGDGNLVLYRGSHALWASMTHSSTVVHLEMQNDGNLVLYTGTHPLWATGT